MKDIEIEARGDLNAKVTKKIKDGILTITKSCGSCSFEIEAVEYAINDWKGVFIEQIKSAINDARERGRLMPFRVGVHSTLSRPCPRCGRDSTAVLNATPSEQSVNKFLTGLKSGDATEAYHDAVEIKAHVDGAHFTREQRGDARDLLTPRCGTCFQDLQNVQVVKEFNAICDALDSFFSGSTTTAPQAVSVNIELQCLSCLKKVKVEYTFSPRIPTDPQQFHRVANRWTHRHELPAAQPQQQPRTELSPSPSSPDYELMMRAATQEQEQ